MFYTDKATILVLDKEDGPKQERGSSELYTSADIVIRDGRVLKNRYGAVTPTKE